MDKPKAAGHPQPMPDTAPHIVMLVANPCDPDYRVVKQAESLARAGYRVTVLCAWLPGRGLHGRERIAGVDYQRHALSPIRLLLGAAPPPPDKAAHPPPAQGGQAPAPLKAALRARAARIYAHVIHITFDRVFSGPLRELKPDIIHAHDGETLPCAARAATELAVPLIFDSHELETQRNPPLSRLRRAQVSRQERRLLPRADAVTTVGERIADYLADHYAIARPTVIFNAPPAQAAGPLPERWDVPGRTDIRAECGLAPDEFLFVYSGILTRNRGLEQALDALAQVQGHADPAARFNGRYHLAAVGRVHGTQGAALLDRAARLGLAERFHLLPPVAAPRVASFIAGADASIIPIVPLALSYELAMPNKLFEAMLSGNPILGSDLTEMGACIREEGLGLTYRATDTDDCARAMRRLVDGFDGFHRDANRQADLAARYAWEAQEAKLVALFDRIRAGHLESRPPRSESE